MAEKEFDVDEWKKKNPKLVRKTWNIIETIILEEYETIKDLTMRNSYYHLLPILTEIMQEGKISYEQFKYFESNYEYYQSDKWPAWEKKHGITRPVSKDPTIGLYNAEKRVFAYAKDDDFDFYRARGFIFIEKSGFLNELEELSHNGWVILAGEGFASREIREQIAAKHPDKPILILHDLDCAGETIQTVWENGSRRTEHLDLKFDNIIDLGLTPEDVEELDLPRQPEVAKYRDKRKWRYEINALTVLKRRDNIKNPIFWYIVKKMHTLGIPICKEPRSREVLMHVLLNFNLKELFDPYFDQIIKKEIEVLEDKDEEVQDVIFDDEFQQSGKIKVPQELTEKLHEIVRELIGNTITLRRDDIERKVKSSAEVSE